MKFLVNRQQFQTRKEIDGNNYLVAYDVPIAKTGIQYYTLAEIGEGNSDREVPVYRDTNTFKNQKLVESFDGMPLVYRHPDSGEVTTNNYKDFIVGTLSGPYEKDGMLYAKKLTIIDREAIDAILDKTNNELSIGFLADVEKKPGKYQGTKFEYVENVLHGNHLALCERGKAGPFFAINSMKKGEKMEEQGVEYEEDCVNEAEHKMHDESMHQELKDDEARTLDIKNLLKKIEDIHASLKPYLHDEDLKRVEEKEDRAERHLAKEHGADAEKELDPKEVDEKDRDRAMINAYRKKVKSLENQIRDLTEENLALSDKVEGRNALINELTEKVKARPIVNAMTPNIHSNEQLYNLFAKY